MKFIHIADIHFDSKFSGFKNDLLLIEKRKLEQREAFKKVINYIKEESVNYLFISGDLYENESVQISTVEYINNLFKEIPNTKIFIAPGNHDPYIKGSIYDTFEFNDNVYIFKKSELEKFEDENVVVYGAGFEDFYMDKNLFENFKILERSKPTFLVMHADLNGIKDVNGYSYNPINEFFLRELGFDYVALGHIHKSNYDGYKKTVYPGSLVSLGFDELGKHGMIIGDFFGKNIKTSFESIDKKEYIEIPVSVDEMNSESDLIEFLTTLYVDKNQYCKVILTGKRKFIINIKDIQYLIDNPNILRIKDETVLGYNLDRIIKENSLRGLYVRKLLEMKNNSFYSEEEIDKAIEIGLESMDS